MTLVSLSLLRASVAAGRAVKCGTWVVLLKYHLDYFESLISGGYGIQNIFYIDLDPLDLFLEP